MITIITLPNTTNVYSSVTAWAGPTFENFLPLALWGTGLTIGALILIFIYAYFEDIISNMFDKLSILNAEDDAYFFAKKDISTMRGFSKAWNEILDTKEKRKQFRVVMDDYKKMKNVFK